MTITSGHAHHAVRSAHTAGARFTGRARWTLQANRSNPVLSRPHFLTGGPAGQLKHGIDWPHGLNSGASAPFGPSGPAIPGSPVSPLAPGGPFGPAGHLLFASQSAIDFKFPIINCYFQLTTIWIRLVTTRISTRHVAATIYATTRHGDRCWRRASRRWWMANVRSSRAGN